jgi:hypothetical protein
MIAENSGSHRQPLQILMSDILNKTMVLVLNPNWQEKVASASLRWAEA